MTPVCLISRRRLGRGSRQCARGRDFKRDAKGILLKSEAIRVAQEKVGGNTFKSDATLVRDEAGFLNWNVTVEIEVGGLRKTQGFLVNAYTGAIRGKMNNVKDGGK